MAITSGETKFVFNLRFDNIHIFYLTEISWISRGNLDDAYLWDLTKRFTNARDVQDLGFKVLGIPDYTVDSNLYKKRGEIQIAAHETLKEWRKGQLTSQEAYKNLHQALWENGWKRWAGELKWVEKSAAKMVSDLGEGKITQLKFCMCKLKYFLYVAGLIINVIRFWKIQKNGHWSGINMLHRKE